MFTIAAMPRRATEKTKPISLRFDKHLLSQLTAIGANMEFPPSLTQLLEAAVREFVARRELDAKLDAKPKPKR